ncbi:tryptophan-rich sensory protein [Mycobacterium simiae]|uniref:tryptophan-rich sensory protein n=1 Tax=Mycobacterium simiae TaxID=1784 RepID=UPI00165F4F23|nr:tryptophan-rich sensory protein [Mycobacterium simiae]
MAWVTAIVVAAICAVLEAWLSGPRPFLLLASLQQPKWALPSWGWMVIGGVFYVIMTTAAATALRSGASGRPAFALVVAVLLTDSFWNYLLFRCRRIDWAYSYLFPYAALVAGTTWAVFRLSHVAGMLVALYLAFLPYDMAWSRALMRLNPNFPIKPGYPG